MTFELAPGDRVVVTGAAGFIGSAVTRALLARGIDVVAILEPGASRSNLDGLDVEFREADTTKEGDLAGLFRGARFCFHLAAKYGFWPKDAAPFYAVNVRGSQNVIRAATNEGVERIVYTSTVATLGLWKTKSGTPSTEDDVADLSHLYGNYKRTKYVAEHEVLRLAAQGAPVVLVLPTMPHGPYDLASGHLLALERGSPGRSYICGGENITMAQLLRSLCDVTGLPPAERRFPAIFPLIAGRLSSLIEGDLLGREPRVPLEAAHMASSTMTFNDQRARDEIGYTSRPASLALFDSAKWFVEHDYVTPQRVALIKWNPPSVE